MLLLVRVCANFFSICQAPFDVVFTASKDPASPLLTYYMRNTIVGCVVWCRLDMVADGHRHNRYLVSGDCDDEQ